MKLIVAIILTALLAFVTGLYFPWWSLAIAAFLVAALVHQRSWKAFAGGFLGIFLLWAGIAWWLDTKNDGVLSKRIAELLKLGGNSFLLIIVTAIIGGLVGGFAAMTGSFLRSSEK
jgi:hypothetical protein